VMAGDWVVTLTYDVDDPSMETMDEWDEQLAEFDASIARIPGHGMTVTVQAPEYLRLTDLTEKVVGEVSYVLQKEPIAAEFLDEFEYARRAEAPSMPELMSAAEIADLLGVTRQRVHQLRDTKTFPAPLADLRGGAVWDAAAVRNFDREWTRTPGRPRVAPAARKKGTVRALKTARGGGAVKSQSVSRSAKSGRIVSAPAANSRRSTDAR
jgi:hypothetical protein